MMIPIRNITCILGLILPSVAALADEIPAAGFAALRQYAQTLGGERREAADFLLEHLPATDREALPVALFRENLEEAFAARENYPWTRQLTKDLFFNDVLPYAIINETRDSWRKPLREMFADRLASCAGLRDAAAAVGALIAKRSGVKYSTKREKACQSPAESMASGMASCTGLSILMVDSLRAAGIPARLATIPLWSTCKGNHTWVEINDGKNWQTTNFGGSPKGWNSGWAVQRCAYCDPTMPIHGVFASSYRPTGIDFPMIWSWDFRSVTRNARIKSLFRQQRDEQAKLVRLNWLLQPFAMPGIDRTAHYIELAGGRKHPIPEGMACVAVRAFLPGKKQRVSVPVRVFLGEKEIFSGRTASEAQDLNDYVRVICPPGPLRVEYRNADGSWTQLDAEARTGRESPIKIETPGEMAPEKNSTEKIAPRALTPARA